MILREVVGKCELRRWSVSVVVVLLSGLVPQPCKASKSIPPIPMILRTYVLPEVVKGEPVTIRLIASRGIYGPLLRVKFTVTLKERGIEVFSEDEWECVFPEGGGYACTTLVRVQPNNTDTSGIRISATAYLADMVWRDDKYVYFIPWKNSYVFYRGDIWKFKGPLIHLTQEEADSSRYANQIARGEVTASFQNSPTDTTTETKPPFVEFMPPGIDSLFKSGAIPDRQILSMVDAKYYRRDSSDHSDSLLAVYWYGESVNSCLKILRRSSLGAWGVAAEADGVVMGTLPRIELDDLNCDGINEIVILVFAGGNRPNEALGIFSLDTLGLHDLAPPIRHDNYIGGVEILIGNTDQDCFKEIVTRHEGADKGIIETERTYKLDNGTHKFQEVVKETRKK